MASKQVIRNGELVQEHSIGAKTTMVGMTVMAGLIALGIAGYLVGQKRAAEEEALASGGANGQADAPVVVAAAGPVAGAADAKLESAVTEAVASARQAGDQDFIALQRAAASGGDTQGRLDKLSKNRAELEAYNRNVMNQVKEGNAAQDDKRNEIEQAVALAGDASKGLAEAEKSALKAQAAERASEGRTVEVRPGDTLWTLAKRVYGDPYQYRKLFEANPLLLKSPDHIFPGQTLRVPS